MISFDDRWMVKEIKQVRLLNQEEKKPGDRGMLQGAERSLNLQKDNGRTSLKTQRIIDCCLIFMLCFLPRLYMALKAYPIEYASDEVSAISVAAKVAGYDWSDVISNAGYYGIGFLWIFAGLFKINLSPIWIYRIMLIVLGIVNALTGPVYYLIMTKYLGVNSRVLKILVASMCGNMICLYVVNQCVRNEEILALLISLTVYFLCKIVCEGKLRDEMILLLILLYSLSCHTRMIALVLTVLAVGLIYYIFYKKRLFHWIFYVICIVGVVAVNQLLNLYRAGIWTSDTGTAVRNSSVSSGFSKALTTIGSVGNPLEVIQTWFEIVIGQIYTATTITGGVFLIAAVICVIFLFRWLIKKQWKLEGQKITESNMIISLFSLALVFMTIASMGVTWFPSVYNDIQTYGTEIFTSSYRAFTYTRYFGVYVPPLIMAAFSIADKEFSCLKNSSKLSVFLYILLFVVWVTDILVYSLSDKRNYFYFLAGFNGKAQISTGWFQACLLGIIFMLMWLWIQKKQHLAFMLAVCLALLECEQVYAFDDTVRKEERRNYQKGDAGYSLLHDLEGTIGEDIYVCDLSDNKDHQIFYIYQYLNYTYHVIPEMPENSEEDFILFINKRNRDLETPGTLWWKLDNNEYVYTNVGEYQETISRYLEKEDIFSVQSAK